MSDDLNGPNGARRGACLSGKGEGPEGGPEIRIPDAADAGRTARGAGPDRAAPLSRRAVMGGAAALGAAAAGPAAGMGAGPDAGPDAGAADPADASGRAPLRIAGAALLPPALRMAWADRTGAPPEDAAAPWAGGDVADGNGADGADPAPPDLCILPHDCAGDPALPRLTALPAPDGGPFASLEADWRAPNGAPTWRAGGLALFGLARRGDGAAQGAQQGEIGGEARLILFAAALALEEEGALEEGAALAAQTDPDAAETVFAALEARLPRRRRLPPAAALERGAQAICTAREAAALRAALGPLNFEALPGGTPARTLGFAVPEGGRAAAALSFLEMAEAQGPEADWSFGDMVLPDAMLAELRPLLPEPAACAARRRAAEALLFG